MKRNTMAIVGALLCCSCYQDIDLEKYRGEETAVLNCIANSDTIVMADISRTWFFTDKRPSEDITGLDVEIYVNGGFKGLMQYDGDKYLSETMLRHGDTITVKTIVDGKELSATDLMPPKTEIEGIGITYKQVSSGSNNMFVTPDGEIITSDTNDEFTYHIRFKNIPGEKRYYFLNIDVADQRNIPGMFDYSYDPVFQLTSERINKSLTNMKIEGQQGLPFSNEGITGSEYSITIRETINPLSDIIFENWGERTVTLYSISEAYYRYVISLLANDSDHSLQGGLADFGISEPVKIYSNITGGTGILGCITSTSQYVDLSEHK